MKEGTPSSKSKQTTVKRRTPAKRKSVRQEAGRTTKYWIFGAGVLALIMLAWVLWPLGSDTYYIDGVSVRLSEQDVNLRDVVWETPTPVLKEPDDDVDIYDPAVSSDDQLMILVKGRPREGADLYMARRKGEGWGDPQPLASINTDDDELGPALSRDGKWLFFYSNRAGGQGGYDLWASRRDTEDWGLPVNLGLSINTRFDEIDPSLYDKPEPIVENSEAAASDTSTAGLGWVVEHLYFASSRPPAGKEHMKPNWKGTARESLMSRGDFNLFRAVNESVTQTDLQFASAKVLDALNTSGDDAQPAITRRGDFLYFASNGRGGSSGFDLFRSRVLQGVFQPVEKLGNSVNTAANETDPTLLREGHQLLFSSDRNSGDFRYQLYQTVSREVFPYAEAPPETTSSWTFFDLLDKYKWWLALLLLSLLALLALLKNFIDESRRAQLTLMQRCLMASLAMHMLLAFLLSFWLITEAIYKHVKEEMVGITLDSGALAAQEEEQALRKPVEAQLTRASASLPDPQQVNPQATPSAQPTQPVQPPVDSQQAQLQEMALRPQEVTLPEEPSQELPAPRLPADPNQPSMLQLPRELLEISRVTPAANPQSAPIPDKLKAQPAPQQPAETNPAKSTVRPPTPTAQKPDTSKPLEQTADTRVDPARLTPAEPDQSLPTLEVSENPQKMELAKNASETSQKMVQASKQVEVQAQAPAVNPAQPASAITQVPTAQQIQAANAQPKKLPVESDIKLPALETAQPQEQPSSTQTFQVSDVKQETNTAAAETAQQMAKASDAQTVSPEAEAVDKANPDIAESSRVVEAAKPEASTAVAKELAVETSAQSVTIAKATAQQKLPDSISVQASAVKQEATTATAEIAQQMTKASASQSVARKNTSAEATQSKPATALAQPVQAVKATTQSAAAKEQAIQAAMRATTLAKASNSQPLPKAATAATDTVTLEQNQSAAESGRQMRQASHQQTVAPQSNQAAQSIPVEAKIQAAQATHRSAQIAVKLQQSTQLSVSPQVIQTTQVQTQLLPKGDKLNPSQQKFEQAKTGIESSALLLKASSSVSLKAASTSVTQGKPVKEQFVPMEAAKAPTASVVAKSQATDAESQAAQLSPAPAVNPMAQTATAQAKNITLEQPQSATEAAQALAEAPSNVKVNQAAQSADASKEPPAITSRAVEITEVAAADSTAAKKSSAAVAKETQTNLKTAQGGKNLVKASNTQALTAKLETGKTTAAAEQALAKASKQQSIKQVVEVATNKASAEPAVRTAEQVAAAKVANRTAATKSAATATATTLETLKTAQAVKPASTTKAMTLAGLKLEATENIAETGSTGAKTTSRQAIKPAGSQADKIEPLASQTAALQIQHSAISLMTTNAVPARLQAVSQSLAIAKLTNPLPNDATVAQLPMQLEIQPGGVEAAQSLAKAVAFTKATPRPAMQAVAKSVPTFSAPSIKTTSKPATSTTATRQTIARAEVQPRKLASAPARPILTGLTLSELPDVETETALPTISSTTYFDTATRGQSIQPANQFARSAPQIAVQPMPFLAAANSLIGQVTPHQIIVLSPSASGQPLLRFQPDKIAIDAQQLTGVLMEASASGRVEVAQSSKFQVVNGQGASVTIKQDAVLAGQPLPVMKETEEPQVKIEDVKVVEQRPTADVEVSSRPLEDVRDPSKTLNLPDIDIPDAPLLEAPVPLKNPLVLRNDPKKRMEIIDRLGGSEETERAIMRALDWFTRNQEKDGHWDGPGGHDHAATGMAMLAYMGWGAKHTEPSPYQKPLAKAVDWMVKHTGPDGDLRGSRGRNFMYDHGIAAIAIAEAYSLTKDQKLRSVVERVVGFTVRAQNPKTGGWRYRPYGEARYTDRGDMSVAGWQIMALKSAQLGGIDVPLKSLDKALKFMDSVGGGRQKSIYGYTTKSNPNPAMVSEGMFCQQLLRQHAIDRRLATPRAIDLRVGESAKYIGKHFPNQRRLEYNYYYWYYACLGLHQQQGPVWERWNDRIRPILLKAQLHRPDRVDLHGSWDPMGKWGSEAGRCIVTGMATLSLEVYYRYLPLYTPTWAQESNKGK